MPPGFPSDFPTYPGAQLTAACTAPGNGSTQWTVQWQTTDKLDVVQAFYVKALDKNDWTLLGYSGDVGTRFTANFARNSNAKVTGTLNVTNLTGPTILALALNTIP